VGPERLAADGTTFGRRKPGDVLGGLDVGDVAGQVQGDEAEHGGEEEPSRQPYEFSASSGRSAVIRRHEGRR
jgi:hypothetical protein